MPEVPPISVTLSCNEAFVSHPMSPGATSGYTDFNKDVEKGTSVATSHAEEECFVA